MIIEFTNSYWKTAFVMLAISMIVHLLLSYPWLFAPPGIEALMAMPSSQMRIGNDIVM